MLRDRLLKTLQYFDVQEHCLTLLELHKYLLVDKEEQKTYLVSEILNCLETELKPEVETAKGMYFLKGRVGLVEQRLTNNYYAIPRLKRAKRYLRFVRHIPFIRAVALTGSEALSNSKEGSDIDLLVITAKNRIWLGRIFLTAFFHIFGVRRHGDKVTNRFCLNHYLTENKKISQDQNIYTAIEYASLMPFFGGEEIYTFQQTNLDWIKQYLNQPEILKHQTKPGSVLQKVVEKTFENKVGNCLERILGKLQRRRIKQQEYILVEKDELAFHPDSKGQQVLKKAGYI